MGSPHTAHKSQQVTIEINGKLEKRVMCIRVPAYCLSLLQNRISFFIWAYKCPRFAHSSLFIHKLQGGLGVPNVAKYYLAAQISQLAMLNATQNIPLWVLLELPSCVPTPVSALLWLPHRPHPSPSRPLMLHSLQLWDSVHYSDNLISLFLPLLSLLNNPVFPWGHFPGGPHTISHRYATSSHPVPFHLSPPFKKPMKHCPLYSSDNFSFATG